MEERHVWTKAALQVVLDDVRLAYGSIAISATWNIEEVRGTDAPRGWLVRIQFVRPDRESKELGMGFGRHEFIPIGSTDSAVVKTAWLLYELLVRHELMEAFTYRGVRIFDPHHTVDELSLPHRQKNGGPW